MWRFLGFIILGIALTTVGIFAPWGNKEVTEGDCSSTFKSHAVRTVETCNWDRTEARYWGDHITADTFRWQTVDGQTEGSVRGERTLHDYELGGEAVNGNGALMWAVPVMWLGVGLLAGSLGFVAVARRRAEEFQRLAPWGVLGAAGLLNLGLLLGVGGMAIHAGTWAGRAVEPLQPEWGAFVLLAAMGTSLWGAVRFFQFEAARLDGAHTPLAPILVLEEDDAPVESVSSFAWLRDLRWPDPRWAWAVASVAIIAVMVGLPIADKDITLRDCQAGGRDCILQSYHVDYGTWGAATTSDWNGTETRFYDYARMPFDTESWLLVTPFAAVATGTFVGLAGRAFWRGRKTWPFVVGASAGLIAWAAPIVHHSMRWAGVPAGSLQPAAGVVLLAIAGGALWLAALFSWRRRANSTQA